VRTVWKFDVPMEDVFRVSLPRGARILGVQAMPAQDDVAGAESVHFWALVDTDAPEEIRRFYLATTGNPFPVPAHLLNDVWHVGSFQLSGGSFVGHLFGVTFPIDEDQANGKVS